MQDRTVGIGRERYLLKRQK